MMAAAELRRHGVLTMRLGGALGSRPALSLRSPGAEAGILAPGRPHDFYVSDLAVSCAEIGKEQWCPEPALIGRYFTIDRGRGAARETAEG